MTGISESDDEAPRAGKMLGKRAFTVTKGWRHRARIKRVERRSQRRKEVS